MKLETVSQANSILSDINRLEAVLGHPEDIKIDVRHNRCYVDSIEDRLSPETLEAIEKKKGEIYNLIVSDLTQQRETLIAKFEAL